MDSPSQLQLFSLQGHNPLLDSTTLDILWSTMQNKWHIYFTSLFLVMKTKLIKLTLFLKGITFILLQKAVKEIVQTYMKYPSPPSPAPKPIWYTKFLITSSPYTPHSSTLFPHTSICITTRCIRTQFHLNTKTLWQNTTLTERHFDTMALLHKATSTQSH